MLNWDGIDDVLLDMDGTLLDRHFDNFFFEEELPRRYAMAQGLSFEASRACLMAMYRSVEGQLAWTDLHYWSDRVGIDVVAMHKSRGLFTGAPDKRQTDYCGDECASGRCGSEIGQNRSQPICRSDRGRLRSGLSQDAIGILAGLPTVAEI
jgi:hypothetical protein